MRIKGVQCDALLIANHQTDLLIGIFFSDCNGLQHVRVFVKYEDRIFTTKVVPQN